MGDRAMPDFGPTVPTALPAADDDARWAAFAARDPAARDAFVVGVTTTGIYCRPSCPARTPKRENVRFFDTVEAARAAGLRACKRCRPDEAAPRSDAIARACRLIEAAETAPSLDDMARAAGLSPHHFHRRFKAETGVTPKAYAERVKERRAKAALARGADVTGALYEAGYGSSGRFYAAAGDRFAMKPARWKAGGAGERLRVATAPCSLGWVLAAATDRGVCAVELGDSAETLRADFAARFPRAEIVEADDEAKAWLAEVVALVDAPSRGADLPLDVKGTAFQERVWQALRAIPAGATRTYGEIAREIGAPDAVRAVGTACGANPVAVVVPCHRVVGANGKLTGYRWGVERKRQLLAAESKNPLSS